MDSQVRVSSNSEAPLSGIVSRLHDTIQEPNISPIKEKEAICVKRTHSYSADTEFGSDVAGNENAHDELGESLCWKKRKREIHDELKCHFEELVNRMMKKQEDMYKVLLEKQDDMYKVLLWKIEPKEKDRITREQIWRNLDERGRMRKETEQMKKDRITREETWWNVETETMRKEERRAQVDTHLSLALRRQVVSTPKSTGKQIISIPQSPKIILQDQSGKKKQGLKKWLKHEVQALISLRMEMQHKMLSRSAKFGMWEEISLGMASMGFTRTAMKCKGKWDTINRSFKTAAGIGQKGAENAATSCPYFLEMDMFYKQCLVEAEIETS
ncbi:trihelix transcription factor GT-2-like [Papaver somniferum]|uniref:trihelix transcription factor GT-2-like n=1 Tax=Papaver somniferum TaxID=3469 RepID=UPI000E703CF2|nr:trihelix transcription factor GT-2-like [Papaver somniferum]